MLSLTLVDADTVQGRRESLSPSQVYCSSKAWIGSSSSNSVVAYGMGKASHCEGMRCIVTVRVRVRASVRARLRVRLRVRLWLWLWLTLR